MWIWKVVFVLSLVEKKANYSFSELQSSPPVPSHANISFLVSKGFIRYHAYACLSSAHVTGDSRNTAFHITDPLSEAITWPFYLNGTTFWINEFMHVGHVTYDIVLIQILQSVKVDRIVLQRAICHNILCAGVGTFVSFFAAYYAAMIDAFQPNTPVYMRYTTGDLIPVLLSTSYPGYEIPAEKHPVKLKPMHLNTWMCFELGIRRGSYYYKNFIGSLSSEAVQKFKAAAYSAVDIQPRQQTYFENKPPFRILYSYRGPVASRHIKNNDQVIEALNHHFPSPDYIVRSMNNSNPYNTAAYQILAVAEANVVITNHGAFQGNLIYMRNGSLMIEISGNYSCSYEFQYLAQMFGVFSALVKASQLDDHKTKSYFISSTEIMEIVQLVKEYFLLKPFLFNTAQTSGA